jgi:hypothetical protein
MANLVPHFRNLGYLLVSLRISLRTLRTLDANFVFRKFVRIFCPDFNLSVFPRATVTEGARV